MSHRVQLPTYRVNRAGIKLRLTCPPSPFLSWLTLSGTRDAPSEVGRREPGVCLQGCLDTGTRGAKAKENGDGEGDREVLGKGPRIQ